VARDQQRNAQAEQELQQFDGAPGKLPALVECPDPKTEMYQHRGIENDRNRKELPEQGVIVHALGKRFHRDIAERMVEEMADQIGEQHEPGGEADLPNADATEGFPDLIARK